MMLMTEESSQMKENTMLQTITKQMTMNRNQLIQELKKYFQIQELVCPHCYYKFGESSWQFISTELLSTLYVLRTKIFNKPITVNTWKAGGQFSQRGLRCNMCQLVKSKNSIYLSAHCLGKAIDFNVKDLDSNTVNNIVRQNAELFEYPIRLEANTDGWSHCDCYVPYNSKEKIVIFTA